jgi:hypothetical protein
VDNQSERGPLVDSNAVIQLLGPPRFFQNGWWVVFRQSRNFAAGEAFLRSGWSTFDICSLPARQSFWHRSCGISAQKG